jgi:hypothetical protein
LGGEDVLELAHHLRRKRRLVELRLDQRQRLAGDCFQRLTAALADGAVLAVEAFEVGVERADVGDRGEGDDCVLLDGRVGEGVQQWPDGVGRTRSPKRRGRGAADLALLV